MKEEECLFVFENYIINLQRSCIVNNAGRYHTTWG